VQLGNTPIVIVNGAEEAKILLLNQSSATISRPLFHVFHKTGSKNVASIGTSPWNESYKARRKVAASALNRPKVASYEPVSFSFPSRQTRVVVVADRLHR
jgi:3-hydroxyphenylacetate 6-hydroxylase